MLTHSTHLLICSLPRKQNAPPRRAAEVLLAEEEEEEGGGAKGSGAPRSSIEDLLAAARSRSRSASRLVGLCSGG